MAEHKDGQSRWIVHYKNGKTLTENDIDWKDLPNKKDITSLELQHKNRFYTISGERDYIQTHHAFVEFPSSKIEIVSRAIGFVENGIKYWLRVDEKTGNCKLVTD